MNPAARAAPSSTDGGRTTSSRSAMRELALVAVPPVAWFVHLNVSYLLVPPSCDADHAWYLVGATVAALAVIAMAAVPTHRVSRGDSSGEGLDTFLSRMGLWFCALFAGATLLVGLSAAIIGPCQ